MELKYMDTKSDEQVIEIKSIDFSHKNGTALVVDNTGKYYEVDIEKILQVKQ